MDFGLFGFMWDTKVAQFRGFRTLSSCQAVVGFAVFLLLPGFGREASFISCFGSVSPRKSSCSCSALIVASASLLRSTHATIVICVLVTIIMPAIIFFTGIAPSHTNGAD